MKNNLEVIAGKKYQWYHDWYDPIAHTDIKPVAEELETIYELRGEIKPEYIIESAKNKKSSLHSYFQWDDNKAANSYRINQATQLLSHIKVEVVQDGKPKVIQAFVLYKRGTPQNGSVYKTITDFTENSNNDAYFVRFCLSDLTRIKTKLSLYEKYKSTIAHIEKAIKELQKVSTETNTEEKPLLAAVV